MTKPPLKVFLHIPKCGGSTVRKVILNRLTGKRVLQVYRDEPDIDFYSPETFKNYFNTTIPSDTDAVIGHIPYSILEPTIKQFNPHIISLVREPIDRCISELNYCRVFPHHRDHQSTIKVDNSNLFTFLTQKKYINNQSWYLMKNKIDKVCNVPKSIDIYKIENYRKALLDFGVISTFDENVEIANITKDKHKETKSEYKLLSREDLTPAQIGKLMELNRQDYELYQRAY